MTTSNRSRIGRKSTGMQSLRERIGKLGGMAWLILVCGGAARILQFVAQVLVRHFGLKHELAGQATGR